MSAMHWLVRAAVLATAMAPTAQAQSEGTGLRPEFRADVTSGTVTSAHLAAGLHVRSGTYFRLAALAGYGAAWRDGERSSAARIELQGRFHLDPFREARLGVYGLGGVSATHDAFREWQARLVIGGGVELPAHGRPVIAVEAALAGGFRLSLIARRLALGRR